MPDLGATDDPVALVPGDPTSLHEASWALGVTADVLQEAAAGLARLQTPDGWSGAAAEQFRAAFAVQPARWEDAATAHRTAADAVEQHAVVLERAQRQAGDAVGLWATTPVGPAPVDPQLALHLDLRRQEAVRLLDDARSQVRASGDQAAAVVEAARDRAPEGPSVSPGGTSMAAQLGNALASLGNAALHHPLDTLGVVAGGGLAAVGAAGVVGGVALDATGVGAVGGIPLGGVSAASVAAGVGLAGTGAIGLALDAAGPDRVTPFRVNTDAEPSEAPPPPFEPPTEITGMTKHGREQAESRNGGVGVSDEAMADAVANPVRGPEYRPNGTYHYWGRDAEVSLNKNGEVVTGWAKTRKGYRNH